MKLLASNRKMTLAVVAGFAVVLAAGCLWFFAPSAATPDSTLLTKRMNAAINLGWGWLHAEDVHVVAQERRGDKHTVTFSYSVVLDKDEDELPPEERVRFREFLPMCSHLPIARKTACPVYETIIFADTKEYGWMPMLFIQYRPEMLHAIANWQKSAIQ